MRVNHYRTLSLSRRRKIGRRYRASIFRSKVGKCAGRFARSAYIIAVRLHALPSRPIPRAGEALSAAAVCFYRHPAVVASGTCNKYATTTSSVIIGTGGKPRARAHTRCTSTMDHVPAPLWCAAGRGVKSRGLSSPGAIVLSARLLPGKARDSVRCTHDLICRHFRRRNIPRSPHPSTLHAATHIVYPCATFYEVR